MSVSVVWHKTMQSDVYLSTVHNVKQYCIIKIFKNICVCMSVSVVWHKTMQSDVYFLSCLTAYSGRLERAT